MMTMLRPLHLVVATAVSLGVLACTAGPSPSAAALVSDGPRRLEVLFLGDSDELQRWAADTGGLHNSTALAMKLAAQWAPEGLNFVFESDPAVLTPATLGLYDVLVLYGDHEELSSDRERALLDFVAAGKGVVALHSASASFGNSEPYVTLIGAQGQAQPGADGEFTVDILQPEHAVFEGVKAFTSWDEAYVHQRPGADRQVLMERVTATGREPWAWTRTHGQGRVFYLASGHDERTWEQADYRRLVRNAILWAAGPEAVQRLQALNIQPRVFTESSPTIPMTYDEPKTSLYQEPLPVAETQKHFQVRPGFELQLFASEPDITRPMAMNWDERGRLWVVETMDFPNEKQPLWKGNDRIKILEDTNHDGRADKFTVFAENLSVPTGIVHVNGGVVVAAAPEFLFLKDTTGDDRADVFEVIMDGWGVRDTHGGPGNLHYGYDNWLWGSKGFDQYVRREGDSVTSYPSGVYRFTADGKKFEHIMNFSGNMFGYGLNEAFDVFGSSANNEHSAYVVIPSRYFKEANALPGERMFSGSNALSGGRKKLDSHYAVRPNDEYPRQVDVVGGFTATTGHMFYTARAFPREYWNSAALVNEPTAHLVHWAKISPSGSIYEERDGWNIVATDDQWFFPVQTEVGPDGAVWILDFHQIIVQHFGYSEGVTSGKGAAYETPYRNSSYGRIYRLVWKGAKPYEPIALSKERPKQLVETLKHDNMFWRLKAQQLLVERNETDVLGRLCKIASDPSVDEIGLNAPVLHALWTMHGLGALDGSNARALETAVGALKHRSGAVRKNALRVLPRTEAMLEEIVASGVLYDGDPQVRLAALLALMDYPPSRRIGALIYQLGADSVTREDEWLAKATALAAVRHQGGFLAAYADDVGMGQVLRVAALAARGERDYYTTYTSPTVYDSLWPTTTVPFPDGRHPLGAMSGTIWLRKTIEMHPTPNGGYEATAGMLRLGRVFGAGAVYVNGTLVSGRPQLFYGGTGNYYVPQGILRWGRNTITVRLMVSGRSRMAADTASPPVLEQGGRHILLDGTWRYRIEERRPPEAWAPRPIVAHVPIAEQVVALLNPLHGISDPLPPFEPPAAAGTGAGKDPAVLEVRIGVTSSMAFDRTLIRAKPGQVVRLTFTNTSPELPHNWVLYRPVSEAELKKDMDALTKDPQSSSRGFVPQSKAVLQATSLLEPHRSATITFTAPATAGDYPYLCTFPGHWQSMRGVLRVAR